MQVPPYLDTMIRQAEKNLEAAKADVASGARQERDGALVGCQARLNALKDARNAVRVYKAEVDA